MMHIAEKRKYNEADYNLLEEGAPFQLINGDLIMSPALTSYHQILSAKLFKIVDGFLDKSNPDGICLFSPIDVVFDDKIFFNPI